MLEVKNLNHWYTNESEALYEDINLKFQIGSLYAILGTSGSGKTTFLSLIAGLDIPKKETLFMTENRLKKSV